MIESEQNRYKVSDKDAGSNPAGDGEKPRRICGECAKFQRPECNYAGSGPGVIFETDEACDSFEWAERPRLLSLGPYTIRVKKDLALIYEGDEPKYPVRIRDLSSQHARKNLAKSLGVDEELVHPLAAKLLEMKLTKLEALEAEKPEPYESTEAHKKAVEILYHEDPIEFIADTVGKVHVGDREKVKLTWLSTITPGLGYELNIIAVGSSGVGKSDLMYIVLCCVPDEHVVRLKECSPKALYYAVKAGVEVNGSVIYFDDVPDKPETVKLLKDITSENRANPRLWSVTPDREFLDVELPESFVVLASAVTNLTDPGGQITRRYLVLNPEEDPEANKPILEHIKNEMRLGRGKRYLPPDFEVAKEVTRLIRDVEDKVIIPFDFTYPDYGTPARSDLKQFCCLIWAVAKARARKRLLIGRYLLAEPQDFYTALELWSARQREKVDETAVKILEQLGDEEPHEDYNDQGKVIGWTPQPVTSTTIARALKEKPYVIRDKLDHLYSMGLVDRKAVGGRGNPYAYWKSPAYFADSESEKSLGSIRLKDDETSLSIISGEIRSAYGIKDDEFNRVWPEYLKRFREQVKTVVPESPEIITKPETGFSKPKKEANFSDLGTLKSLGSVAAPERVKEKPAMGELLRELRSLWSRGPFNEFDDLIIRLGGYDREEAERLREGWIDEGLLAYDPKGYLVWVR